MEKKTPGTVAAPHCIKRPANVASGSFYICRALWNLQRLKAHIAKDVCKGLPPAGNFRWVGPVIATFIAHILTLASGGLSSYSLLPDLFFIVEPRAF
ncbi:MAG: hypothetical protein Q4G07_02830 [Oscillospiraceae bacterium]|nr:hypothetical protein [Oscillospiraceae bacterium]